MGHTVVSHTLTGDTTLWAFCAHTQLGSQHTHTHTNTQTHTLQLCAHDFIRQLTHFLCV